MSDGIVRPGEAFISPIGRSCYFASVFQPSATGAVRRGEDDSPWPVTFSEDGSEMWWITDCESGSGFIKLLARRYPEETFSCETATEDGLRVRYAFCGTRAGKGGEDLLKVIAPAEGEGPDAWKGETRE